MVGYLSVTLTEKGLDEITGQGKSSKSAAGSGPWLHPKGGGWGSEAMLGDIVVEFDAALCLLGL